MYSNEALISRNGLSLQSHQSVYVFEQSFALICAVARGHAHAVRSFTSHRLYLVRAARGRGAGGAGAATGDCIRNAVRAWPTATLPRCHSFGARTVEDAGGSERVLAVQHVPRVPQVRFSALMSEIRKQKIYLTLIFITTGLCWSFITGSCCGFGVCVKLFFPKRVFTHLRCSRLDCRRFLANFIDLLGQVRCENKLSYQLEYSHHFRYT